jgi:glycine/D-amino acid oxidase-like deaminating enzyme
MAMPGRVEAAGAYLYFANHLRNPPPSFDGQRAEAVDLTAAEQKTYDAAIEVLRKYFEGEADFGDQATWATARADVPDDNPEAKPTASAAK